MIVVQQKLSKWIATLAITCDQFIKSDCCIRVHQRVQFTKFVRVN